MSDFQYILPALAQVFTVTNLALIFGGLILGMIVGCIPGLSVTVSYTHLDVYKRQIPDYASTLPLPRL